MSKKLANVNEILLDSENLEKYKQFGELLNCNMHNLSIGMDKIEVINFYDNNNLITRKEEEMINKVNELINDKLLRNKIGKAARKKSKELCQSEIDVLNFEN